MAAVEERPAQRGPAVLADDALAAGPGVAHEELGTAGCALGLRLHSRGQRLLGRAEGAGEAVLADLPQDVADHRQ